MSYLVLARKYRPQRFDELIGQEHVARTLTNAIAADRVHHAFLFTGARGVGKTSAARILAKALSCQQGPTADPCGVCEACQEIAAGRSVDVIEIDGASNTGVDDVRTLREGTRYMPAKGRIKIYIIDEVHMLSTSAFNALLKTLEEPPPHVVFIFATTEAHKIPSTILSRCQRYDFKLIPTVRLTSHLEGILTAERISFTPDGLLLLARQAAGSVRDGLSLLDQVIAYVGAADGDPASQDRNHDGRRHDPQGENEPNDKDKSPGATGTITREIVSEVLGIADRALLVDLARSVLARDAAGALRALNGASERGLDLGQVSRSFLGLLRDIEVAARVPEPEDLLDATPDELIELRALAATAGGLTPVLFDRWARAVDESGRATAPRLLLEMAAVDLCQAEPLEPLGDLLQRLEELEGRLRSGGPARPPVEPGARSSGGGSPGGANNRQPSASSSTVLVAPAGLAGLAVPAALTHPSPSPPVAPSKGTGGSAPSSVAPAEAWRRARAELERRRPRIGALLASAHVLELDSARLVLGFEDRTDVDAAERVRSEIEQALSAETGAPVHLVVKQAGGNRAQPLIRAEAMEEADALSADKHRREQEARQHPIIQKAQDLFGVSIREIKT